MKAIVLFISTMLTSPFISADILTCESSNGKKIYTDDKSLCKDRKVEKLSIKIYKDKKVGFRYPKRSYQQVDSKYSIYIENSMFLGDQKLTELSQRKLENALEVVFSKLPVQSHQKLKNIEFYILWGDKSPNGGENSGMRYISKNSTKNHPRHDSQWDNAIIIYSADNLMYLTDLWTKKALTHELSHAWHLLNWKSKEARIMEPWDNSRKMSLYLSVKDLSGKVLSPAYASKNQLEYFAELSAMYFVGGNYLPFSKENLRHYDPTGYTMVEYLWGIN